VNVGQVAHNVGASVSAIFPAGGTTGEVYADILTEWAVPFRRIKIDGSTREGFTINEM
jgi:6-phosphofructokinase 2